MYVAPVDIKIVNTAEVRKILEEYEKIWRRFYFVQLC